MITTEIVALEQCIDRTRMDLRITNPGFGEEYAIETNNVLAAAIRYKCGVLGSFHVNAYCGAAENRLLTIFGTKGILSIDDPNCFGSEVTIEKPFGSRIVFPSTHGFMDECRGVGAAEMAWAIRGGRKNRVSKEMSLHVLEMLEGIDLAAEQGRPYCLTTDFDRPRPLKAGVVTVPGAEEWMPTEESAIALGG